MQPPRPSPDRLSDPEDHLMPARIVAGLVVMVVVLLTAAAAMWWLCAALECAA